MEVIEIIEKEIEVIEVIERGPQGADGEGIQVLTTQGDLVYRGSSGVQRLGIGTAGQTLKVNAGGTAPEWGAAPASGVTSVAGRTGDVTLAKSDVGLGNVDNTSDANKPISTATQTALDGKAASSHTHTANQITDFDSAAQTATALQYDGGYPYAAGLWDYSQNLIGSDVQDKRLRIYNGAFSTAAIDASGVSGYKEFDLPNASGTLALTTTPPASHTHGNIANDGKIGSTANLPLITTTAGAVTTGAFGTGATDFCAGNDSRLSDARTPTSHTHGNITNSGAIGSTSGLPIKTGTSGVLEAGAFGTSAGQFAEGNHTHSQLHNQSHVITSTSDHTANNWKVWYSNGSGQVTELSLGAANTVLTSNGASSAPTFTAPAAGGSKTYARFTALDNQPTSANFATLDTRNSIAVLDFDDASTESAVFVGVMPEGASLGSGLIVYLHFMATTATSGNVRWSVAFERSNTDLDADSFDTATAATVATSGTSGIVTVGSITCTAIDGITAGDLFRLRVQRLGADAADTMTGDAELIAVEVRSAA